MDEPPYHGKACPMCPNDVRCISACIHNFLVRWPGGDAIVKLHDLTSYQLETVVTSDPVVQEMLDIAGELIEVAKEIQVDGLTLRWTTEVFDKIAAIEPRAAENQGKIQELSDAHFDDSRHSHDQSNLMCPRRGARHLRFGRNYEYDYTMTPVALDDDPDLIHNPCRTGFRLHEHFLERLKADPAYYSQARCSTCGGNHPFREFTAPIFGIPANP